MITGNQLLRIYPDNELYDICKIKFGTGMVVCFIYVIIYVIVKLIISYILAILYNNTIAKLIRKIANKECAFVNRIIKKILI